MIDLSGKRQQEIAGAEAVRRSLAAAVRRLPSAAGEHRPRRAAVPARGVDLFGWIASRPAPRGYWRGRGAGAARAFSGVAARFEDPARLCAQLTRRAGRQRYYGGLRFDPERSAAGGWEHFGPGAFTLPRFELTRDAEGVATLACYLASGDEAGAVAAQIEHMRLPSAAREEAVPAPVRRHASPEAPEWAKGVEEALAAIAAEQLHKVVLARRVALRFERPVPPVALLRRLVDAAPEAFHFFFQPARAGAFLGVTPERLFRQRGQRVWSEAVAGTRPRASSPESDAALRKSLLQSEKDRREHAFVQCHVRRVLEALCTAVEESEASALTLRRGRHLYARLQGRLRDGVTPAEVLAALHPTPAIGGVPTAPARRFIRAHEPFDRGWYAAPVGWIGVEDGEPAAELAVGIRSGLVRERRLDLFSGAGLVEGSVPAKEWDEVEQKLGNFAAVLGMDDRAADDPAR